MLLPGNIPLMCNRCEPAQVVHFRDVFGWTHMEWSHEEISRRYIGPNQRGTLLRDLNKLEYGDWGLIPWFSPTRLPATREGKRLSTNNCRAEGMEKAYSFRQPWERNQRCLVPVMSYDEPYWGPWGEQFKKSVWWRFRRKDKAPWMMAGLWNEWTDRETGEVVLSYTMITTNCDRHALLGLMHKPDPKLPEDQQDKRTLVPLEHQHWETWLTGTKEQAKALLQAPAIELFDHGAADPAQQIDLGL